MTHVYEEPRGVGPPGAAGERVVAGAGGEHGVFSETRCQFCKQKAFRQECEPTQPRGTLPRKANSVLRVFCHR